MRSISPSFDLLRNNHLIANKNSNKNTLRKMAIIYQS